MREIYNGSLLRIKVDGQNIFDETDSEISMELSTRERATKDTSGVEIAPDLISWSASGNSLGVAVAEGAALGFEALFDKFDSKTIVEVEFTTDASGSTYYKGQGFITSLSLNGSNREDATCSWSITGSGVPEKATVA